MQRTLRKGTIKDIPSIKKGLIDSWVEHAHHEPELLDEGRMRRSDVEKYYRKAFKPGSKSFVIVAEVNGKFAGFMKADILVIQGFFKHNQILYLDDIYVFTEFMKKGVAGKLIHEAEAIARQWGIKRLQGRVYSYNKPAQKLLSKHGFRSPFSIWDKVIE